MNTCVYIINDARFLALTHRNKGSCTLPAKMLLVRIIALTNRRTYGNYTGTRDLAHFALPRRVRKMIIIVPSRVRASAGARNRKKP